MAELSTWAGTRSGIHNEYAGDETLTAFKVGYLDTQGEHVNFEVSYMGRPSFIVNVGLDKVSAVLHEVRYASMIMFHRQRLRLDRGMEKLLELCETAMRPREVEVLPDPSSGDRLLIFQFNDHSPMVLRMSFSSSVDLVTKLSSLNRITH